MLCRDTRKQLRECKCTRCNPNMPVVVKAVPSRSKELKHATR